MSIDTERPPWFNGAMEARNATVEAQNLRPGDRVSINGHEGTIDSAAKMPSSDHVVAVIDGHCWTFRPGAIVEVL